MRNELPPGALWVSVHALHDLGASPADTRMERVQRGDYIRTNGKSTRARFVGVSPMGVLWCAYADQDYRTMCERFDARWGRPNA